MNKNESGFSIVETMLVIIIVALIVVVGYMFYENHHKTLVPVIATSTNKTTTNSTKTSIQSQTVNPYTGWKTYSLASLGVNFQYPSTWTVTQGQPQCTGAILVTITPGNDELSQTATTIGANLNQYTLFIDKYGTENTNCSTDGNNFKGDSYAYLQSSGELTSGVFKNNWLTFFGSTTGNKSQLLPDTGIVTDSSYQGPSGTFMDAGTLTYKGSNYQIDINTSSVVGQQYTKPVPMNITLLKTTNLYKDTLGILNSFN